MTRKEVTWIFLGLLLLGMVSAFEFTVVTQNNFDQGNYTLTEYNTTGSYLQLSISNVTGNYTSQVFNGGDLSQWQNLVVTANLISEPLLVVVDFQDDVWTSRDGISWNRIAVDYNSGDGGDDSLFFFTDSAQNFYSIEDDDDVWQSTNRGLNWTKVNDDYNGEAQRVERAAADLNNNLYLIESDEDVWKSTDSGLNWSKVNGSDFNGGNGNVKGLLINRSNTLFAVDVNEDVWTSTDGISWKFIADDLNGAENSDVSYVVIDSSDFLYAIEDDDDIWQSTNSGFNWTKIRTDYNGEGQHVTRATIDYRNSFYIIESDEDVWKSTDSGLNWSKVNGSNFNGGNGNVAGLTAINSTTNYTMTVRSCAVSDCSDGTYSTTGSSLNVSNNLYFQFLLTLTAEDNDLTPQVMNVTLQYADVGAPNVSVVSPSNGNFTLSTSVDINVSVTDGTQLDSVVANITLPDNSTTLAGLSNTTLAFYNLSYISPLIGNYTFTILANDTSNNLNDSMSGSFSVDADPDTTAPLFSALTEDPLNGTTYNSGQYYAFNSTWTDNIAIDTVFITFDGVNYSSADNAITTLGTVYAFNITGLATGDHNYTWFANDTSGNENQTSLTSYTVLPAEASLSLLLDGSQSSVIVPINNQVNVTTELLSGEGIIQLFQDGILTNQGTSPLNNLTTYAVLGIYNLTSFYPTTQNFTSNFSTFFITVQDTTAPSIISDACLPDPSLLGEFVTCNATITDNLQIDTVSALINLSNGSLASPLVSNVSDIYTFTINTSLLGAHIVQWFANDTSDNQVSDTNQTFTVASAPDTLEPSVILDICTPDPSIEGEDVTCNATIIDNVQVDTVFVNLTLANGTLMELQTINTGSSYSFTVNVSLVGTMVATWRANDTSNNLNASESQSFTINQGPDVTPPSVNLGLCSPNPSILGQDITCTSTVTDDRQVESVFVNVTSFTGTEFQPAVTNVSDVYSFTMNTSTLGVGMSTLLWITNDTSNNINDTTSGTFEIQPPSDIDAPIIIPDICTPDPSFLGENVFCNATITDDVQMDTVLANVTLGNGLMLEASVSNVSDIYSFTVNGSALDVAMVLWIANDTSNNVSYNNDQNFTVILSPDTESPVITVGSCAPDPSIVGEDVVCNATVTDNRQVALVTSLVTFSNGTSISPSVVNESDIYSFTINALVSGEATVLWETNDTSDHTASDNSQSFTVRNPGGSSSGGGGSNGGSDSGPGALRNAAPGTTVVGNSPQPKQTPQSNPSPSQGAPIAQQPRTTTSSNALTGAAVGGQQGGITFKNITLTLLILALLFFVVSYILRERRRATKHLYINKRPRKIMVKDPQVLDKLQGYVSAEVLNKLKKGDTLQHKQVDPKDKEFAHQFPETAKELQDKNIQVHPKKFTYERMEQVKKDIAKDNKTVSVVDMKKLFPETLGKTTKLQQERFVFTPRSQEARNKVGENDFSSHYTVREREKPAPTAPKQAPQTSRKINKTSKDDLLKGLQEVYKIE